MANKAEGFKEAYGIQVAASSIFEPMAFLFQRLISKPGDGQALIVQFMTNTIQHKTSDQVDAMDTGMGAKEPLQAIITTAGSDTSSP